MNAKQIIESYIDDVALRLPRRLRNDVGLELRALLNDELEAAAKAAGRAPDENMIIALLHDFGRPQDIAARYQPPRGFTITEPEHGPLFVRLAAACMAIQWALTLPLVFWGRITGSEWWLSWGWSALWWPGLLVVYFGAAAWIRRRWPVDPRSFARPWSHWIFWLPDIEDWQPIKRRVARGSVAFNVPFFALFPIFFVSPAWFLGHLAPDGVDVSWVRYDPDFRQWPLAPLIGLMVARLSLYTLAAVSEHWQARTQWVRLVLWVGFGALLVWPAFGWDIFASELTDFFFKAWLWIFLLVNCLMIGFRLRRALARVRVPKAMGSSPR